MMSLPPALEGLADVLGALSAGRDGTPRASTGAALGDRHAQAIATSVDGLGRAGGAAGLSGLRLLVVKGADEATVAAVRPDELLLVSVGASKTAQVERALHAWAAGAAAPALATAAVAPVTAPAANDAAIATPPSAPLPPAGAPPPCRPEPSRSAPAADRDGAWRALRCALARGLLTEAAARGRELAGAAAGAGRPGAEPVAAAALDGALQALSQGIGSVLAGDGHGGARALEPLGGEGQPNLSLRWLALYWSGRAALRSGDTAAARRHLKPALALAKQLDGEALPATQWVAGEVLAHDGDASRALAFLGQARLGFERHRDGWGLAQAWLAEARVLAALGRDGDAGEAARKARAADPSCDEPTMFLARRALAGSDLAEAERLLQGVEGPAAERVRSLVSALRSGAVGADDAGAFLRHSEAPPSAAAIRALERISSASPGFLQAREALAWMLLKSARYPEASQLFRGLLSEPLAPADRASVMLGLGCIAHAQQKGKSADVRLHAAVAAAGATPTPVPVPGAASATPPPAPGAGRSSQLASTSAVFSGQLSVFALPDVVEFVRTARRTGLLVCSSARGMAAVHFRRGRITGAASAATPRLGELLVGARKLSSVALRALTSSRRADAPDHVLGEELVREGLVDAAAVEDALRRQAEATLLEIVSWTDGEFAFNREADDEAAGAAHAVELDAQELLLNVVRQLDEGGRSAAARP